MKGPRMLFLALLLIPGGGAAADVILLKSGEKIEAYLDGVDQGGSYLFILPDGDQKRVAVDDVMTFLEVTTLPLMETIEKLETRVKAGEDEEVIDPILAILEDYPKSESRVRSRLARMLREIGKQRLEKGNKQGAWAAFWEAVQISPGDLEALGALEELRRETGAGPRVTVRSYFPMQTGARWSYAEEGGGRVVRIVSVKVRTDGAIVAEVEATASPPSGKDALTYSLEQDEKGIWKVSSTRTKELAEPVVVGTRWTEQSDMVVTTWEYVALSEKVEVRGKTYADCLKVRITAQTIPFPVDPVIYHRYYARGIGLVKTEWPRGRLQELTEYRIEEKP